MSRLKNGILLDMRSINSMQFDAQKQQVTVGGGVLLDEFTKFVHTCGMEISKSSDATQIFLQCSG
jgi:FAD/FMN-containing dehydrogenase